MAFFCAEFFYTSRSSSSRETFQFAASDAGVTVAANTVKVGANLVGVASDVASAGPPGRLRTTDNS